MPVNQARQRTYRYYLAPAIWPALAGIYRALSKMPKRRNRIKARLRPSRSEAPCLLRRVNISGATSSRPSFVDNGVAATACRLCGSGGVARGGLRRPFRYLRGEISSAGVTAAPVLTRNNRVY